tara:strand:- start:82 stop:600 length:519 start_codon:yes stop_codon:yes gene_type:complete
MSKSDSPVEDVKFFQESGKVLFTGPRNPKDLKPLCIEYGRYADNEFTEMGKGTNGGAWWLGKAYGFDQQGYIMPCCWAASVHSIKSIQKPGTEDPDFAKLKQDKFHLSKIKDIKKDVLQSEEWKEFANKLVNEPEKAPKLCWYFCGKMTHSEYFRDRDFSEGEKVKEINKHK